MIEKLILNNIIKLSQFGNVAARNISSSSAAITKIHRKIYARSYPTLMVNPDGSTFTVRHHDPRAIITLPVDISKLTDAERKVRLERRKPRSKVKIEKEVEDNFKASKYLDYMRKKK